MMREGNNVTGLRELCEWIQGSSLIMAEIGSFAGESAQIFLDSGKFQIIHCIDPWTFNEKLDCILAEKHFDSRFKEVVRVDKLKMTSEWAATMFAEQSLDLVYIDAKHDYESVKQDINLWKPKVKSGGYLCGHDYDSKFLGVVKAVGELLGKPRHVFCDGSWIVRV